MKSPTNEQLLAACRSTIPEGKSGDWEVKRFVVSAEDERFERMRSFNPSTRGRFTPAGTYTALRHRGAIVMSDTPNELEDHLEFLWEAKGHVLINGLGLGCALAGALVNDRVWRVTVIEISMDVIDLVAPHFLDHRVEIIHADAHEWKPPRGVRYGAVWHDIWPSICEDNLPSMKQLHQKYSRRAAWQGSWSRDLL